MLCVLGVAVQITVPILDSRQFNVQYTWFCYSNTEYHFILSWFCEFITRVTENVLTYKEVFIIFLQFLEDFISSYFYLLHFVFVYQMGYLQYFLINPTSLQVQFCPLVTPKTAKYYRYGKIENWFVFCFDAAFDAHVSRQTAVGTTIQWFRHDYKWKWYWTWQAS